jgi:murein L,D-transpeptidase YafK
MVRLAAHAALLATFAVTAAACGFFDARPDLPRYDPALYAGSVSPVPSPTPAFGWADGNEYAVVVRKGERTLSVYHRGEERKVYPIVLGVAPFGPKTYQGDLRTPEGVYRIAAKKPHARWARFLLLSYPNDVDYRRYAMAVEEGRVPIVDGRPPGPGHAVGIHGTDREESNVRGIDWTWGCISMFNQHVAELYDLVPVGTPVLIEE